MKNQEKKQIFRQESLERLSSPEKLDQLMQIVGRQDWLPLSTLGALVVATIIWSIFGRIPVNVTSRGLLIIPRRVANIQSPVDGQLQQLKVKPGDCIKKNRVIATIDPFEIRQNLQLEQEKLAQLQGQEQQADTLQNQRTDLEILAIQQEQVSKRQRLQDALKLSPVLKDRETKAIEQERSTLQQQLQDARALTPTLRDRELKAIAEQQLSLQQQFQDTQAQAPLLKQRSEKRRSLSEQGAISSDAVLEAEQEYRQSLQDISQLKAELKQLETQKTEVEQKYLDNLDVISQYQTRLRELNIQETETQQKYAENLSTISQLRAELQQLDTQVKILEQQNLEASAGRKNPIQEVQHSIAQLEKQLEYNKQIKSPHSGCILELTAENSSVLNPGDLLGSIKIDDVSDSISSVAYFPVGDGKKIKSGMKIYITPDTVRRERFGGIVGTVTEVSAFPITKQGATSLVGNAEVVEEIVSQVGSVIAVQAQLQIDPSTPSGYRWSSSTGPNNLEISSGTTTIARVTVEKQAPIALVLPILREWSGIIS
ncbi:NHLP bacteriocin system secretion protein [Hyella patelloides LEGE 07179]|uniref:NHLP bacteriocin system secretion protein n=1 Tax=Hyella patelloides LEGE 07179 TaxID=945734 RepID=A0A563W4E0_9CYAN|nr:NHLP bacteriocin system secretion protein [Hyella patelloides]VEP18572.1 NHLP bacteriocin system secretion protein [Hyella patelloides LEGE 07179]